MRNHARREPAVGQAAPDEDADAPRSAEPDDPLVSPVRQAVFQLQDVEVSGRDAPERDLSPGGGAEEPDLALGPRVLHRRDRLAVVQDFPRVRAEVNLHEVDDVGPQLHEALVDGPPDGPVAEVVERVGLAVVLAALGRQNVLGPPARDVRADAFLAPVVRRRRVDQVDAEVQYGVEHPSGLRRPRVADARPRRPGPSPFRFRGPRIRRTWKRAPSCQAAFFPGFLPS